MISLGFVGTIASVVVGAVVGVVTIVGVVTHNVDSQGCSQANANNLTVQYGSTSC